MRGEEFEMARFHVYNNAITIVKDSKSTSLHAGRRAQNPSAVGRSANDARAASPTSGHVCISKLTLHCTSDLRDARVPSQKQRTLTMARCWRVSSSYFLC